MASPLPESARWPSGSTVTTVTEWLCSPPLLGILTPGV